MWEGFKEWIKQLRKQRDNGYRSSWNDDIASSPNVASVLSWTTTTSQDNIPTPLYANEQLDKRIEKKPVEVVNEILSTIPEINLANLDEQIKVIQRRLTVFKEQDCNTRDEVLALSFLKARKKLEKNRKAFGWPVATTESVNKLCSKYKLRRTTLYGFARNIPMEAVDEIEKFGKAFSLVAAQRAKPSFHLIIDDGGKETKKDPILLAESPFGTWYFVLGAWDKEVQYVDDLVYNGK